jgi:hypothetical protein
MKSYNFKAILQFNPALIDVGLISPSSRDEGGQSNLDFVGSEDAVAVVIAADRDRYRFKRIICVVCYITQV